jgi:hypothetical protein
MTACPEGHPDLHRLAASILFGSANANGIEDKQYSHQTLKFAATNGWNIQGD